MQKCHSIIVTGKVQDIGFRSIVEHIGRSFGIPGLVFNARDGSVKILCSGEDSVVDNFTQTIRVRGEESGAKIKGIKELLLPFNIDLPDDFSKVSSDDEIDLGRKLDKGNLLLESGFENLNTGLNDIKIGINNMTTIILEQNTRMDEHNIRMDEHNIRMDEHNIRLEKMMHEQNARFDAHNTRLEAILEKLVNK